MNKVPYYLLEYLIPKTLGNLYMRAGFLMTKRQALVYDALVKGRNK
tara:strand:- start:38259 stop:38396 length:138 start_codon:yes stop_codon:yes gene_type:complete